MILYNLALAVAALAGLPILLLLVLCSEKRRRTVLERLGLRGLPPGRGKSGIDRRRIWVHALSVGEAASAVPLVRRLREHFPGHDIFFSASTRTGFLTARRLLKDAVRALFFFPYDLPFSVARVVRRVSPDIMVIIETDLWPNFLADLNRRAVPVFLVNARLSRRSYTGYRRLSFFTRKVFLKLTRIGAPSAEDGRRWAGLGVPADRILVTGNIKFDQPISGISDDMGQRMRRSLAVAPGRRILVAGSTHDGEETHLADAFLRLREACPGLCLVAAPRDPARAAEVRRIFLSAGIAAQTLTAVEHGADTPFDALVVDRIGLLSTLYPLGDAAFVGGSLVDRGGHNPLEPAAAAVPVFFGPHMSDFREIAALLMEAGGALEVPDGRRLAETLKALLDDPARRAAMGRAALDTVIRNRGAVDRTVDLIAEALPS
ncbi:3-deoxy-D-manno-octulosonic acid transferase [Desulfococcus sp.]|uniref:3-deoxy-D-manno-octulosonic acid transferase n=1 Tax=Desulfococcus sp. TaxID=2025834 RepID=UPI003593180E